MATVFYKVTSNDPSVLSIETNWDIREDGDYIATDAATHFHEKHDGGEATWPVTITLHETIDGPVISEWTVEMEYAPSFSARGAAS